MCDTILSCAKMKKERKKEGGNADQARGFQRVTEQGYGESTRPDPTPAVTPRSLPATHPGARLLQGQCGRPRGNRAPGSYSSLVSTFPKRPELQSRAENGASHPSALAWNRKVVRMGWKQTAGCVQGRREAGDQRPWLHTAGPTAPEAVLLIPSSTHHDSRRQSSATWKNGDTGTCLFAVTQIQTAHSTSPTGTAG